MDFSYLLDLANQNKEQAKNQGPKRCLSTKFSKPKKLERSLVKSDAVKKFLAKRESEDQRKAREAAEKKEKLLSLRAQEKGTKRRVNAMVKRNKAANKSVLEDAKDQYNTAATVNGCYQPDTDDYGYVSKEAEQMYSRLLQRYDQLPDDKYLRDQSKRRTVTTDLSATKARVKESLDTQDIEEREAQNRRLRRKKDDGSAGETSTNPASAPSPAPLQTSPPGQRQGGRQKGPSLPRQRPPPPGLDFSSILRLAAEKQHEPLVPPVPESAGPRRPAELDRPMTASQRREAELERVRRLRKLGKLPSARPVPPSDTSKTTVSHTVSSDTPESQKAPSKPAKKTSQPLSVSSVKKVNSASPSTSSSSTKPRQEDKPPASKSAAAVRTRPETEPKAGSSRAEIQKSGGGGVSRRQAEDRSSSSASAVRPGRPNPSLHLKQRPSLPAKKARVIDSDSEEYDSEMDDFIDDGPLPGEQDYSSAIREIFGYDKSKFRDEDDNCSDMEADFSTVMNEERRSAKIGKLEDDEELRKEMAHKKRKMALKSKFW